VGSYEHVFELSDFIKDLSRIVCREVCRDKNKSIRAKMQFIYLKSSKLIVLLGIHTPI
jgi:hypothetical protein